MRVGLSELAVLLILGFVLLAAGLLWLRKSRSGLAKIITALGVLTILICVLLSLFVWRGNVQHQPDSLSRRAQAIRANPENFLAPQQLPPRVAWLDLEHRSGKQAKYQISFGVEDTTVELCVSKFKQACASDHWHQRLPAKVAPEVANLQVYWLGRSKALIKRTGLADQLIVPLTRVADWKNQGAGYTQPGALAAADLIRSGLVF